MTTSETGVRDYGFADFRATPPEVLDGHQRWLMRGQNFWLEWVELGHAEPGCSVASDDELLVIAPAGALRIQAADSDQPATAVPVHSVCILAPGRYRIAGDASAKCMVFASQRTDLQGRRVLQEQAYATPDPRIPPTGHPYRRRQRRHAVEVMDIDAVMASKDKPRLKILQTETLSINIVEYNGPRNRAELSPHSHASFEQGSFAIAGDFVHHLRTPWTSDADQWREDVHLQAPSPSLMVVPVELVHTSEGVGPGHHFLVDLFSPPRADFIAKGWVFNAADYEAQR